MFTRNILVILFTLLTFFACTGKDSRQMHEALMQAKAQNENFEPFTTDSTMLRVVDYYDAHGTANEQMLAHYLLGCVYRDLGDAPRALECYHDAVSKADTTDADCDFQRLSRIYGQMADLFYYQHMPDKEIMMLNNYSKYALKAKDTLNHIKGYELLVRPYFDLEDTAKIIEVTNKCHLLYKKFGYLKESVSVYPTLIHIYLNQHKYDEAKELMNIYECESGLFGSDNNISKGYEHYYYSKGLYYCGINKIDSAEYYFRKLLNFGFVHDSYKGLTKTFQIQGKADSIVKYSALYVQATENYLSELQMEDVRRTAAIYDYSQHKIRLAEKTAEAARNMLLAISITLVLASITIIYIVTYKNYRKQKSQEIQYLNKQNQNLNKQYREIKDQFKSIEQIENEQNLTDSDIYKKISHKAKFNKHKTPPTTEEWQELLFVIKENLPVFYNTVCMQTKLSVQELHTTILTRLNFRNSEIAILLDVTPQQVTNNKSKANFKIFGINDAISFAKNLKSIKM